MVILNHPLICQILNTLMYNVSKLLNVKDKKCNKIKIEKMHSCIAV